MSVPNFSSLAGLKVAEKFVVGWVEHVAAMYNSNVTLFFFYKNKVYKNVEPQICQKIKNILDAEIVTISQLFLSPHMKAQNSFSARKLNFFGVFWGNIGTN